jgi:hypothetical protein
MAQTDNSWYVLVGEQKYGPYEYKSVIRMLQTNQLMDYNYVWAPHLNSWTQIHQLEEFSASKFQLMIQNEPDFMQAFVKRTQVRKAVDVPLLGHNHLRFFDGQIVSISEAGGLCLLNSPLIQLGDKLKLHIKSDNETSPAFNVECEVIRKNFSKQRLNSKSGLYYAVRFHDMQPVGLQTIQNWISSKAG